jgi:hypothetical protein
MRVFYTYEKPGSPVAVWSGESLATVERNAFEQGLHEFWVIDEEGTEIHFVLFDGRFRKTDQNNPGVPRLTGKGEEFLFPSGLI